MVQDEEGKMIVADNGNNTWDTTKKGHARLIEAVSPAIVEGIINTLMQRISPVDSVFTT